MPIKSRKTSRKSPRKTSRKTSRKKSRKTSRKSPRKTFTKKQCMSSLKRKIGINIGEYNKGNFSSRQQAIAVSYSQVKKMKPYCSRYMKKK